MMVFVAERGPRSGFAGTQRAKGLARPPLSPFAPQTCVTVAHFRGAKGDYECRAKVFAFHPAESSTDQSV